MEEYIVNKEASLLPEDELEKVKKLNSKILSIASHDLKSPPGGSAKLSSSYA